MRDRTFQLIDANLSNLFVCVGAVDLPCGFFDSSGKVVAKSWEKQSKLQEDVLTS